MRANDKTFSPRVFYLWVVFILLQSLIVIGIISTYFVGNWVSGPGFTAGLRKIEYNNKVLSIFDDIDKICKSSEGSFHCKASKRLLEGEKTYMTLTIISCIFTTFWIFCSILLSFQRNFYLSGFLFGVLSLFFYIMGIFVWIFQTGVGRNGCDSSKTPSSSHSLCFESGFKYNLYLVGYILIIFYIFFMLGGVTLKKLNLEYMTLTEGAQGMPSRALDETCVHTNNRSEMISSN